MKKVIAVFLTTLLFAFVVACGNEDVGEGGNSFGGGASSIGQSEKYSLSEYVKEYNKILRDGVEKKTYYTGEDSEYIACAETLLAGMLRNPSSAQYNSAAVYEKDNYGRVIVYMDVSSQNGFGGWGREEYYFCIQSLDKEGNFTYLTYAYYVTGRNSQAYELLKSTNDFGKDPVDAELEGMLLDEAGFEVVFSVELAEGNILECYMHELECAKQYVYIDKEKHVVAIRNQISDTTSLEIREDAGKICVASVAALTGEGERNAKISMSKVASLETLTSVSADDYFEDGFVYECDAIDIFYFTITAVDKGDFESEVFWTPNNTTVYYEKLADEYLENTEYDKAIYYYEKAGVVSDKLMETYYRKAEKHLAEEDYETAGQYFGYAKNYKDAQVRMLEVYYQAGVKQEEAGNYISAIKNYEMAGNHSDAKSRLKKVNYEQGKVYCENKQYVEAIDCFKAAADYEDAKVKYKEMSYLQGEQLLVLDKAEEARVYFNQAGDYKDASTRLAQYFYEKGCEYFEKADYAKAIEEFKASGNYEDAKEKYKESNYLQGEKLLEKGQVESAAVCFDNASGYADADTRMQRFFYEKASEVFEQEDYLSAEAYFIKADTYQDAATMVLECYYLYGKQQLELNYVSNATKYLSKCRGYKDTDDILLGYYYTEATKAVNAFTKMVHEWSFVQEVNDAYEKAQNKLLLCEGYKDSVSVLKAIEKIYYLWDAFSDEANYAASFGNMTVENIGETVTITQGNFTQFGGNLTLVFDIETKTFQAEIKNLYWNRKTIKNVMCALVRTLTGVKNTEDLSVMFEDDTQWISTSEKDEFYVQYGGYLITVIEEATEGWYVDCTISATK